MSVIFLTSKSKQNEFRDVLGPWASSMGYDTVYVLDPEDPLLIPQINSLPEVDLIYIPGTGSVQGHLLNQPVPASYGSRKGFILTGPALGAADRAEAEAQSLYSAQLQAALQAEEEKARSQEAKSAQHTLPSWMPLAAIPAPKSEAQSRAREREEARAEIRKLLQDLHIQVMIADAWIPAWRLRELASDFGKQPWSYDLAESTIAQTLEQKGYTGPSDEVVVIYNGKEPEEIKAKGYIGIDGTWSSWDDMVDVSRARRTLEKYAKIKAKKKQMLATILAKYPNSYQAGRTKEAGEAVLKEGKTPFVVSDSKDRGSASTISYLSPNGEVTHLRIYWSPEGAYFGEGRPKHSSFEDMIGTQRGYGSKAQS